MNILSGSNLNTVKSYPDNGIKKNLSKPLNYSLFTVLLGFFSLLPFSLKADASGIENLKKTGKAFASVAKKVSPAVVFIKIEKVMNPRTSNSHYGEHGGAPRVDEEMLRRYFGGGRQRPSNKQRRKQTVGQGSGFLITSDGYILTNNHVITKADDIVVKMRDGREFKAKVIGKDPKSDVAVIKIKGEKFPFLELGDSDKLEVGEWVVAIGNPFGLSHSLTAGIVSAKGRNAVGLADYENFIQTDAAINPGNSGGPLVNLDSQVIGMNSAIFSRSGGYMGIGFAIPVNMIKSIKDQLIKNGAVTRGLIGVIIQDITPELAKMFNVKNGKGIIIAQVMKDSPADKAGLKSGDVVLTLDKKTVENINFFRNAIAMTAPGTEKKLTILREDKTSVITITVGNQDNSPLFANSAGVLKKWGFQLRNLTPELSERLGYANEPGVVISEVSPTSTAAEVGLRPGMLILSLNRMPVKNIRIFNQLLAKVKSNTILLFVRNGRFSSFVVLRLK